MAGTSRTRRVAIVAVLGTFIALALAISASGAITSVLVSRTSNGDPANGYSSTSSEGNISASGRYVAFDSASTNLPGGNGIRFLTYLRDMRTGSTALMSKDNAGQAPTGAAVVDGISANGDVVSFHGSGTGLPGADPDDTEVWVRDRSANRTILVSKANNGDPADGEDSVESSLSTTGRYVAFASAATNLPNGTTHAAIPRIYVRDMKLGHTALVSRTTDGRPAFGFLCGQSISADGSRVVWRSHDPDLPGANGFDHIYMRDLETGRTTLIDRRSDGVVASGDNSDCPSISGNGRFVVFSSFAMNLPGAASNAQTYRRDTQTNKLVLVSRNKAGEPANGNAIYGHPSGDGRFVAFQASATNLPGGDGNTDQVYVRDLQRGRTSLLSKDANGDPGNANSADSSISTDGRWVSFNGPSSNLGATPPAYSVFRSGPTH
jgi:Tol biopolymer transport system component